MSYFSTPIFRTQGTGTDETTQDIVTYPMPSRDVKINGQVKYAVAEANLFKKLFTNYTRSSFISQRKPKIIYASCFADGVYRYPSNFHSQNRTVSGKSNIVKLQLSGTEGNI